MKKILVVCLIPILNLGVLTEGVKAQRLLFGVDAANNTIVTIANNGSTSFFATLPFNWEGAHRTGFDFNPADGLLYAAHGTVDGVLYYSINPATAEILNTGKFVSLTESQVWHSALGFNELGNVFAYGDRSAFTQGSFIEMNFNTLGVSIKESNSGTPSVFGGDYDALRNVFWVADEFNGKVYQLDPATGANIWASSSTWPTSFLGDLYDMDVSEEDVLVVAALNSTTPRTLSLLDVDPSTGVWTEVFQFASGTEIQSIASVPEPSTYALLLLSGAASLYALRRRKS